MPESNSETNAAPASRISVERDGDSEIWVVSGTLPDGFNWSLPILALPYRSASERWFQISSSGSYTNSQYSELTPILDAHDHCPGDERAWWFSESSLSKFARKHPGINREFVIVWPGHVPSKAASNDAASEQIIPEPEPGLSSQETMLLKRVAYLLSEVRWEILKLWWIAIRKEIIRQLAVERKPVDLGFAKLMMMPYRINWKEALCIRFGSILQAFRKTPEERHEAMRLAGMYAALSSVSMLALDRRKHFIHWTLETVPSPELEKAIEEHEYARQQKLGACGYARRVLDALSHSLPMTLDILRYYARRVGIPPAKRKEGDAFGSVTLVPAVEPGHVRPGKGICEHLELSPEGAFSNFTEAEPEDLAEVGPGPGRPGKIRLPRLLRDVPGFKAMVEDGTLNDAETRNDVIRRSYRFRPEKGVVFSPIQDPNQEANGS